MIILPIFIPHKGCPYHCIYCDQQIITGSREINFEQISDSIGKFCSYHSSEIKEIAFYGGTFTSLEPEIINKFLTITAPFIDQNTGIRISTRPDAVDSSMLQSLKDQGLSTVELGIQSFNNNVLRSSGRKYTKDTALKATEIVYSHNLKLGIQLMPGLPGYSPASLEETITTCLEVKPDFVRIYPTIVIKNTGLDRMYLAGNYMPLSLQEAVSIAAEMTNRFQEKGIEVIKTGLHSDIDKADIQAGPYHEAFGELVRGERLFKKIIARYPGSGTFVISKFDISLFKGFKAEMIRKIKEALKINELPVILDQNKNKGDISFSDQEPHQLW